MLRIFVLCLVYSCLPLIAVAQPAVDLQTFASGLASPIGITHAGDERLFVIERSGRIRIIDSKGQVLPQPFLDIDERVQNTGGQSEQGLLGLAFHPQYAENGYFYVNYIGNDNHTRIARFQVSPANPNIADPNSEQLLLFIQQPYLNHNGGHLAFGPDGYLYIGMGDGGSANDPNHLAQNPQSFHGKMLRIDVDSGNPYAIPPDNPYADDDFTLDEIWAFGLRNPWRFSFDRLNGDLWIGDVGQSRWEEINREAAGGEGGNNYGWRCFEGNDPHIQSNCLPNSSFTPPLWQYDHQGFTHCSVTGGYVYRGNDWPGLYGRYLYADFCSGQLWLLEQDSGGDWSDIAVGQYPTLGISSFGEDRDGELYLASLAEGRIYKIGWQCDGLLVQPSVLDESCAGAADGSISLEVDTPADSFAVQWSDGSSGLIYNDLSAGNYAFELRDSRGCVWADTLTLADGTPAAPMLQSLDSTSICAGEVVRLQASAAPDAYRYRWLRDGELLGDSTAMLAVDVPGEYRVYLEGACRSDTSAGLSIQIYPEPLRPEVSRVGDTLVSTSGFVAYQWFKDGAVLSGQTEDRLLLLEDGVYSVEVLDTNGCMAVSELLEVLLTVLWDQVRGASLVVYPNPFQEGVVLRYEGAGRERLRWQLFGVSGQQVKAGEMILEGGAEGRLAFEHLLPGIYFLQLQSRQNHWRYKLVKS